ncbi:MAG TPA: MarR family winged helix-turn-helix transcriptional regulator [Nitrospirota bacterium]|nr:MarR family winged helix-turn-helix transcriptional regulator [Nitrospirota bacterium]
MDEKEAEKLARVVATECIGVRVRILNRVITNIFDRALQPLDLKLPQVNILVMLALYGKASPGDIGGVLQMEKSTVSRNLERMRNKGWIEVTGKDVGQSKVVSVTAKGRKLLKTAHVAWEKAQRETEGLLGDEGVRAVRKLHEIVNRAKAQA